MNLRHLKPHTLRQIATQGREEYKEWLKTTKGEVLKDMGNGMKQYMPADQQDVWDYAFSRGASAILKRVDKISETT